MNQPRERQEAFERWHARVRQFRGRRFPTEWAKVVNGVGLVSLVMSAERVFGDMAAHWNPEYVRRSGLAQATAVDLNAMVDALDRVLPALPPEALEYFDELRMLAMDGVRLLDTWWKAGRPLDGGQA